MRFSMQVRLSITDSFSFTSLNYDYRKEKSSQVPKVQIFKRKSLVPGSVNIC